MKTPEESENLPLSRARAIAEGRLVDLGLWAKWCGFKKPVACSAAVWNRYVVPNVGLRALYRQFEQGRAIAILLALYAAIGKGIPRARQYLFEVILRMDDEQEHKVRFKVLYGPGDTGQPVRTILLPEENYPQTQGECS